MNTVYSVWSKSALCAALMGLTFATLNATAQETTASNTTIEPVSKIGSYYRTTEFKTLAQGLSDEAAKAPTDQAKIVIYRPKSTAANAGLDQAPQSFFINGDYQASLLPGGYTVQNLCAGNNRLSVAVGRDDRANPQTFPAIKTAAQKVYFFEAVQNSNGTIDLSERKISDLADVGLLEMQTIPRYIQKPCSAKPEKIVLDGNGFFDFDRSGMKDLQQTGRDRLDNLVKSMKNEFETVNTIKIDGYTDRFGSQAYNEKLSLARAETVKAYFAQNGINAVINTQGFGPANPVVTCPGPRTKAVTDCLYPNRRIEVSIDGVRKPENN